MEADGSTPNKLKDKAQRLFEFIRQVYAIDLPIERDVTGYGTEVWWQAEIVISPNCKIKTFDEINGNHEPRELAELTPTEDVWLSITKRTYDDPPELPSLLQGWVDLSSNPTRQPSPKPSILKVVSFDEDIRRVAAYNEYITSLKDWTQLQMGKMPNPAEILSGWIESRTASGQLPTHISRREFEEKFEDNKNRIDAMNQYLGGPWKLWTTLFISRFKSYGGCSGCSSRMDYALTPGCHVLSGRTGNFRFSYSGRSKPM